MMDKNGMGMHCGHRGIKMGLFLTAFGSVFLLGGLGLLLPETVAVLWPLVLVIAGLLMLLKGVARSGQCGCCEMPKKGKR